MSGGASTALALVGGIGDAATDDQAGLFDDDHDAPMPIARAPQPSPKGGRPPGSRNRSTEQWRQLFLSRYQSPLMVCGEVYTRSPEELARALGMTREVDFVPPGHEVLATIEAFVSEAGATVRPKRYVVWDVPRAFELQSQARDAALPYLHQRQPLAIEAKGERLGVLVLGDLHVAPHEGEAALPILDAVAAEIQKSGS